MQAFISRKTWVWTLAIWIGLTAGCRQPEPAEYYGFQDLQIIQAPGAQPTLATVVKLYNPNPYPLQLRRAEVDVAINGKHAGHSLLDSTIYIPKRDTFYVPVSMQVDLQAILSNALQAFLSKQATITLDGRIKVKKGMLIFNRPFHYETREDIQQLLQNSMGL
ncbi:MAG TPA: LEA type 2 family protein [Puia sp.]|jgi:LEA14-like dessication related protein|nr:LEA type 2 family protein [Puia sp.]